MPQARTWVKTELSVACLQYDDNADFKFTVGITWVEFGVLISQFLSAGQSPGTKMIWMDPIRSVEHLLFSKVIHKSNSSRVTVDSLPVVLYGQPTESFHATIQWSHWALNNWMLVGVFQFQSVLKNPVFRRSELAILMSLDPTCTMTATAPVFWRKNGRKQPCNVLYPSPRIAQCIFPGNRVVSQHRAADL